RGGDARGGRRGGGAGCNPLRGSWGSPAFGVEMRRPGGRPPERTLSGLGKTGAGAGGGGEEAGPPARCGAGHRGRGPGRGTGRGGRGEGTLCAPYLTEPAITPWTKWRWKAKKTTTGMTRERNAP